MTERNARCAVLKTRKSKKSITAAKASGIRSKPMSSARKAREKSKYRARLATAKNAIKKLADEQAIPFPKGSQAWKDTGFQGYEPQGGATDQPTQKPKRKELTAEQKRRNQEISKERVSVEHGIGGVKVFGIARAVYRNFREGFDDLVMETSCGLHNWRLEFKLSS